ncbi:hypothetical protein ANN_03881, partial [Periplaneta americana]
LKAEAQEFPTHLDFYSWKRTVEDRDVALFVKTRAEKVLACKSKSATFYCHRSGYYTPKVSPDNRKRELKIQGSSKIDGYCPARMKTIFHDDGRVLVEYCATHVGHKNELAQLHLHSDERKEIATKIAMKVSYDEILTNVRSSVTKEELKRKHLITKHDLYNIEREFF